tara:strand:- start:554 stop:1423 length:870 start_codon:yes stop_codon:yes gene_type:complete
LESRDISFITKWSRNEGFAPGAGDVSIYRHTDNQGLWVGCLDTRPIGCIAGVRYNSNYGFIGLFLVIKPYRGLGYGVRLWKHALNHLSDLPCIGLEAAPERISDYETWGFRASSLTTRWKLCSENALSRPSTSLHIFKDFINLQLLEDSQIPESAVYSYDAKREPSPRPHFISDWLHHPAGKVLALVDSNRKCHGFGRIRPCLLKNGKGWRIGPLIADSNELARFLIDQLIYRHPGNILIDSPGLNTNSYEFFQSYGFEKISETLRMYRGFSPSTSMSDVYGLACLELG